jgi:hypothetical protein
MTQSMIDRLVRELGSPNSGLLGKLINLVEGNLPPSDFASINQYIQQITDLAFQFQTTSQIFFRSIEQFLLEQREGNDIGCMHTRENPAATRTQPARDVTVWEDDSLRR